MIDYPFSEHLSLHVFELSEPLVNIKKCKLIIMVVSVLSFPQYCLTADQLVYRHVTQTTETNG